MMPEETVQATRDLNAKALMPVHWGKFRLGMHAWNEPVKRVVEKARELSLPVRTPKIGELLIIGAENAINEWWNI